MKKKILLKININKGLHRAKHDTTARCRQGKVEQVYNKSKRGHCIFGLTQ